MQNFLLLLYNIHIYCTAHWAQIDRMLNIYSVVRTPCRIALYAANASLQLPTVYKPIHSLVQQLSLYEPHVCSLIFSRALQLYICFTRSLRYCFQERRIVRPMSDDRLANQQAGSSLGCSVDPASCSGQLLPIPFFLPP